MHPPADRPDPAPQAPGAHRLAPLLPRDPDEPHRVASPLELLFDLTFAVAFSLSGAQFAHLMAEGHYVPALLGFVFSSFGIVWAWVNYSWFASAYDNDDWGFRLMSMVVMVGVVVFALGLAPMYASIESEHFDNRTMIIGYVVMRLALIVGWGRAWRADVARRQGIVHYVAALAVTQVLWMGVALLPLSVPQSLACGLVLILLEVLGPFLAERRAPTPWHAHHISERYSLLAIITLGEGIIGTVAALSAVIGQDQWSLPAVQIVIAGVGLTFGMWWMYFSIDVADILHHLRVRSFAFGYLHLPLFAAIAATGAGLHIAALWLTGEAHIPLVVVVAAVAAPVFLYVSLLYVIYYAVLRGGGVAEHSRFHVLQVVGTLAVILAALAMAALGVPLGWCLLVVAAGPFVTVVTYEIAGYRHVHHDRTALLRTSDADH